MMGFLTIGSQVIHNHMINVVSTSLLTVVMCDVLFYTSLRATEEYGRLADILLHMSRNAPDNGPCASGSLLIS